MSTGVKPKKYVNRLQARITKAVKEQKWHLGQRKKQPLRIPTVNDRIVQMLHVITLSGKEILRVDLTTVSIISPLLANMTPDVMEDAIASRYHINLFYPMLVSIVSK